MIKNGESFWGFSEGHQSILNDGLEICKWVSLDIKIVEYATLKVLEDRLLKAAIVWSGSLKELALHNCRNEE